MADKEKKEGGKFSSNKKGKLDSLANSEGIGRALNVATKVAIVGVSLVIMWKFFGSKPTAATPPKKQAAVEKQTPAQEFPPIVVNLAGWGEWVRINPAVFPRYSRCYFDGSSDAEVEFSSGKIGTTTKHYSSEEAMGSPVAFRGEAGQSVTIICKKYL